MIKLLTFGILILFIGTGLNPSTGIIIKEQSDLPLPNNLILNSGSGTLGNDPIANGGVWWNSSWLYRKEVLINHSMVNAHLVNFPVLISFNGDSNLAAHAQLSGNDIVFTDSYNKKLNHEIELFDHTSGKLIAWVNVTSLNSTTDTTIWMYYGNNACSNQQNVEGVWDSHYVMVQHLKEAVGTRYDSTQYGNDGVPYGSINYNAAGKIDGADSFDGSDYINCGTGGSLDITNVITVEAWINPVSLSNEKGIIGKGTHTTGYSFKTSNNELRFTTPSLVDHTSSGASLITGVWQHVAVVFQASNIVTFYKNGQFVSQRSASAMTSSTNAFLIGNNQWNEFFNGGIDEIRISNTARNSSWIKTCYNNQQNPNAFYSIGFEELNVYPDEPVVSDEIPQNKSTAVSLNPMLQVTIADYQGDDVSWWILSNASGSWLVLNTGSLPGGNGTISATPLNMNQYGTRYWWSVHASDGLSWTNTTFSFTTTIMGGSLIPDWRNVIYEPFPVNIPTGVTNPVLTLDDITDRDADYVADPYLFYENGLWYMFFEVDYSVSADIGLATSTDGINWAYDRIVHATGYHQSFPQVFKWNGTYYMTTECVPDYVKLFKSEATDFPYHWTLVDTLLSGRDFADPTIFRYNGTWWMFVSDASQTICWLYYSENLTNPYSWTEHPRSPIAGYSGKVRPSGRSIVFDNDRIIRFTQKCDVSYGGGVCAFEIDKLTRTDYAEHEIPESPIIQKSGSGWNSSGMHTFNPWWTGNRWIAAVDGSDINGVWAIGIYATPIISN